MEPLSRTPRWKPQHSNIPLKLPEQPQALPSPIISPIGLVKKALQNYVQSISSKCATLSTADARLVLFRKQASNNWFKSLASLTGTG